MADTKGEGGRPKRCMNDDRICCGLRCKRAWWDETHTYTQTNRHTLTKSEKNKNKYDGDKQVRPERTKGYKYINIAAVGERDAMASGAREVLPSGVNITTLVGRPYIYKLGAGLPEY